MSNLEEYKEQIKKYKEEHPELTENELIRYVYMDLGERLSFNLKYAFGNRRTKKAIYETSASKGNLEAVLRTNEGICKEISYILENVLKNVGVNIKTEITDPDYLASFPHVSNLIIPKEGKEYYIDLQSDLKNIKAHAFTTNFGRSFYDRDKLVFTREEIEEMDRKLGFVNDNNYYSDEYIYLLKMYMQYFDNFEEKINFVLENIDAYQREDVKYAERKMYHEKLLKQLFTKKELRKIYFIDCYEENDNKEKEYKNCIALESKEGTKMYIYSDEENTYCGMSIEEFARKVQEGLTVLEGVPGLRGALKKIAYEKAER